MYYLLDFLVYMLTTFVCVVVESDSGLLVYHDVSVDDGLLVDHDVSVDDGEVNVDCNKCNILL